ncbi:DUF2293 domain-containing protein [Paludibaculum fermentans]|uniref:DUF2293 domain-containing protein n=1 Tax=Paludibaculum fermentans TaxID=1473598 RepID=UPI003EBF7BB9
MANPFPKAEKFRARVIQSAEQALATNGYVAPLDVFLRTGLLVPPHVDAWRKGRVDNLVSQIQGSLQKQIFLRQTLEDWAREHALTPSETRYARPSRDGAAELRFSVDGNPLDETFFRTHYLPASMPEKQKEKLTGKLNRVEPPVVFQILRDSACSECGVEVESGALLYMEAQQPLCLACARMDELEYLEAGDAALTRRSTKYSSRTAVVVRFSRSRGRYERQGILVEPAALERAERECAADADQRAQARAAGAVRREKEDRDFTHRLTRQLLVLFPGCPPREAERIAAHTAVRGSGRVGRSAAARKLDDRALHAAVAAAVRHNHTDYDQRLAAGADRESARAAVGPQVHRILDAWRNVD